MARYYESEALIEFVKQNTPHMNGETTMKCVEFAIKNATTADVAEVVRCKDCKHWCIQEGNDINQSYFCSRDKMWCMPTRKAEDFCSYGERKE